MLGALLFLATTSLPAQRWQDLQGRSPSGIVALHQAVLDAGTDTLALVVASHPDDRYVLPAAWLRYRCGVRVAVLLVTRGGGGQNSQGPETGDALEHLRTLEAEAGCARLGADIWYLDRPDAGYCRTAEEAFAEWGRQGTLTDMVRLIRTIRPDVVLTTHHAEESHGHDLAIFELLPEAVAKAADDTFAAGNLPPFQVQRLFLGAPSSPPQGSLVLPMDEMEPLRGATLRRLGYQILEMHLSQAPLQPMDVLLEPELVLMPVPQAGEAKATDLLAGLRSLFDDALWPAGAGDRDATRAALTTDLTAQLESPIGLLATAARELRVLQNLPVAADSEADRRRDRRVEALQRVAQHAACLQVEVEATPGAVAVPGEELTMVLRLHDGGSLDVQSLRAESTDGGEVELDPVAAAANPVLRAGHSLRASMIYRVPLDAADGRDAVNGLFHGDRFVPPVRLCLICRVEDTDIPIEVNVPVELRAPVELDVVPPALLLPATRQSVQFTVEVQRNSSVPVEHQLEVRAPTGYSVDGSRRQVKLRDIRGDSFLFTLRAPEVRRGGVDQLRILLGDNRITLPVHKVDVTIDPNLRIGLVRGSDDTLLSVINIGGFGLHWSELSDTDIALRDLDEFDTIVVDIRALRNRPEARRSFRRLLDFCAGKSKRLVVFYHKDSEFNPPGEGFRGAPELPFTIGKNRVARADAPVTVLRPNHVLLTHPNVIRAADWDGWEQERGLYFPSVYAPAYEELVEMHDPSQPAERGSLLYLETGQGEYVYCALSLYRQLKKLHPGVVRLLANLLTPGR